MNLIVERAEYESRVKHTKVCSVSVTKNVNIKSPKRVQVNKLALFFYILNYIGYRW
jgi:hypothetical protein